jgi:hypothetical protein
MGSHTLWQSNEVSGASKLARFPIFGWLSGTSKERAKKLGVDKTRPRGLKPALIWELYAALKRRSSTVLHAFTCGTFTCGTFTAAGIHVLHAFVSFSAAFKLVLFAVPACHFRPSWPLYCWIAP